MSEDVPTVERLQELLGEVAEATEGGPAGMMTGSDRAADSEPLDEAGQEATGAPGGVTDMALEDRHCQLRTAARHSWYAHAGTPRVVFKDQNFLCCSDWIYFTVSRDLVACGLAIWENKIDATA